MSKRIVAIIIATSLFVFSVLIKGVIFSNTNTPSLANGESPQVEVIERGSANKQIARISVEGTISGGQGSTAFANNGYNHEQLMKQLEAIQKNQSIKGVLLYINTPGGSVYESAEIHRELKKIIDKGKKIYVSMGGTAASGGYYIATAADKIFATKETLTGSLGVIMQNMNYKELANNYGVKFNTIKSGEFKDIMSPTKEMTEEDREILESLVNESYEQFVSVIEEGRGMSEERVKELADGRIYSGQQALDNGLVDQLGFEEEALKALKNEVGGDPRVISFKEQNALFFNLPLDIQSFMPNSEVKRMQEMIDRRQGPKMMYLYTN